MSYKIEEIEGIGPTYGAKLTTAGIRTTDELLSSCASAPGRKKAAVATGLSEGQLLKWANMADMMRIKGIGPQFAELLEAAGVDTVKELRTRNAENLASKMAEVNEVKNLANAVPALVTITGWIEQAGKMDPTITH